ncbi:hypothetical protein H5410_050641 [Solanum commersonii]|uniref:Uncharacterized protein n=1 Tax=Solanum commersonii TaxID=4109 RepID=A0A9J5WYG8_SOLCO|nr:hypothetical protein H5410_050641 [Solanum commersonii]
MSNEKTKLPFQNLDWTFLIPTDPLPKSITHSYEHEIAQIQHRWKDHSKRFPTIAGSPSNSS